MKLTSPFTKAASQNATIHALEEGMNPRNKAAASSIFVLFTYYEIYRWIPLGRWNWQFAFPVSNDQFYPDILIGALLLWFLWSFSDGKRAGMWVGSALLTLWVVVHCFDWWVPYARDLPGNAARYSFYKLHTQILRVIDNHYPPDAGHAVLDFLLFPTCFLALVATFAYRKCPHET